MRRTISPDASAASTIAARDSGRRRSHHGSIARSRACHYAPAPRDQLTGSGARPTIRSDAVMGDPHSAPSRNPGIEEAPLQEELMLFDPKSGRFYMLNPTMAFLWKRCDGTRVLSD